MEAIGDLIGALFAALFEMAALGIELAVSLLALVAEFLFVMATQGLAAAKERWGDSKSHLDQRRAARKAAARDAADAVPVSGRTVLLFVGIGALTVAVTGGTLWISHTITQRKIAETRLQVAAYADEALEKLGEDAGNRPVAGLQADRDAWGQPLEMFIDEGILGALVVVRSAGPDRTAKTIDDIHAFRTQHAGAGEIGRELGQRAVDKAKEKAGGLLDRIRWPERARDAFGAEAPADEVLAVDAPAADALSNE
jgi:hypothetical protein